MSIYVSGSCLFLSFSLNICNNDQLYYHSLFVYMSISWSVFLSFFVFQCLYQCSAILSLIVILFSWSAFLSFISLSVSMYRTFCVYRYVLWFVFLSLIYQCPAILSLIVGIYVCLLIRVDLSLFLWRFLLLFDYNYCDSMYVYGYISWAVSSLCISFSLILSECVYQCPAILSLIVGVYERLLLRVSLCVFLWRFLFGYNYWDWVYVHRYVFYPPLSLSLSLCLSQHPGILSVICMYMNKCDLLTQRVIALKIHWFYCTCIRTFLDSYFFLSLCLWMCVAVSCYIITQCRCKYTSLVIRVPHSLFLWMFVSMFGPFITD